jgi:hypothetical protein
VDIHRDAIGADDHGKHAGSGRYGWGLIGLRINGWDGLGNPRRLNRWAHGVGAVDELPWPRSVILGEVALWPSWVDGANSCWANAEPAVTIRITSNNRDFRMRISPPGEQMTSL